MLFDLPDDDILYQALMERDPSYEGFAYVGVKSTGVFCKLTCPARKPKRENVLFHPSIAAALEAGFRPCKRCRPMNAGLTREPAIDRLLDALEHDPNQKWSEKEIIDMGYDPSAVRRAFRRQFGITFLEIARLRRIGRSIDSLAHGAKVIEAQVNANYDSGSGFRNAIAKLIGVAPKNVNHLSYLKADWIETPIGTMIAIGDKRTLYLLEFLDRKALPGEIVSIKKATGSEIVMGREEPIDLIEEELGLYFAGKISDFTTPLAKFGTPFTNTVWDALRTIPMGQVRSYSDIARQLGNGKATRAVARANGANQIAIVIPCHRVIGADGSLTGYGGGLWRKKWLIEHERRMTHVQVTHE
ncbi:bifunctional transcriptional activator/DNA repair protein Ada [Sodalis ligni]|uniref:bifunctional transcriptional activator/DNA repair enzyme AdaA n=1 Tax=Sodalis ligni TaxID=2697027 RepID=UPI00194014B6|nr:trifunctional transcriptional activator/DNA repair protein Ada/methylated-DNA--[protein]-cysteine S-methyltransferase [Sodalis ligni]QWA11257.1 bifunctional transcriptional activator/DNA repair protein Ada [Sodalis ligni]